MSSICESILRVLALLLTLAAAIVIGVNKQTEFLPVQFTPAFPVVDVAFKAKWYYLSALVYLMVANIAASAYAAISTLIVLATRTADIGFAQTIIIFDVTVVGLLFSANGAALAVGIIGYKGNSHLQWNKVCNVFDNFCDRIAISIVMSLVASFAFIGLVALAVLSLQKRFAPRS
ncbi:CASP-like protein 1E1 [Hibiscus syriacus]|uniref:CASP-like protein n=1 Tax=Hibiscus syriacus TaxID=106335 RepID=A0A6A3D6W3_HIBSY|nr:CASP-like protein 1E1 [Hibiscus syriacus]KAE8735002.1 CASP-like protein 1E1 [Hibiscus syriacus]